MKGRKKTNDLTNNKRLIKGVNLDTYRACRDMFRTRTCIGWVMGTFPCPADMGCNDRMEPRGRRKMKIIYEQDDYRTRFENLSPGDVFIFDGLAYMKIQKEKDTPAPEYGLNMCVGTYKSFFEDEIVTFVPDAELI